MRLLSWLVQLFSSEPQYALHHNDNELDADPQDLQWWVVSKVQDAYPVVRYPPDFDHANACLYDTKKVLTGLTLCFQERRFEEVAMVAAQALLKLHEPDHVEQWNQNNLMPSFWEISSNVFISLSIQLIGPTVSDAASVLLMMEKLLILRNEFLLRHRVGVAV